MQKLKSRKLWAATITAVVMWVSALAGVELDPDQVAAILLPVIAYILGEAWVDARRSGAAPPPPPTPPTVPGLPPIPTPPPE